ncbi:glucose-1-phosphate cytidylyltransferase [Helicobacter sp. 11S02629-2]|uniref:glucose-1-phosphate cytidylyltransferase n=1 Tax=Helicobacter sp. 11S02629-2 TaxID=1476195 RepID=UPI000BA51F08|nr:glucose-1-phosphate cytidylyltransferase [Helicobacter sp. 11S02629-2]PAF44659.1 glucose-1-phosphate cytidylyltransferase [Helicobacter sp. 11S02629-2]
MKVVILAGGLGTRLAEETRLVPKPMVEIGGKPILWHIMKYYAYYGFDDFIILTGYKSHIIKDYFINYYTRYSDITVDMDINSVKLHQSRHEPWKVTMLYTGEETMTGSRIKKAQHYIGDETFMLTYGDGLSDIDLNTLLDRHKKTGKFLTLSAVQPSGKFGALDIDKDGLVHTFKEKPQGDGQWINGGFMVCESQVFDYIDDGRDDVIFEQEPLMNLAKDKMLNSYKHNGFWYAMDTLKGKNDLNGFWKTSKAPWAKWL